ncbi:MAG: hypothetical protein OEM15_06785 [Myxococcales bacterium]|nr:hypothetical protein [Myxococcales bacterium]
MGRRRRFKRPDEAQLSTAAKVRVHLGALGGAVPEVSLGASFSDSPPRAWNAACHGAALYRTMNQS